MVGINRSASITFNTIKELKDFEKHMFNSKSTVSMASLQKKVKEDGIVITRGNSKKEQ